ncbi:hypothetical protein O6R05_04775 [Peptoniphilus equinus]|uniref:PcfB family protein n=1 Tax=Peptoniphilus equinus TaxID=3016343 RepID=A0ABY7QWN8_9FIRM|nr:hypothetical protein [Peptoniphilus equinus]WBW50791.1 hypothetical protein O6R05_04775 [Peptoniphilus equinus]
MILDGLNRGNLTERGSDCMATDMGIQEGVNHLAMGVTKTGLRVFVFCAKLSGTALYYGLKDLADKAKDLKGNVITQSYKDGQFQYQEGSIPKFKNNEYVFDKSDEALLKKHMDKYGIQYHIENIDQDTNKVVFLARDKETMLKAVREYIADKDVQKSASYEPYRKKKERAEDNLNKTYEAQSKDKDKVHKREKNFEAER